MVSSDLDNTLDLKSDLFMFICVCICVYTHGCYAHADSGRGHWTPPELPDVGEGTGTSLPSLSPSTPSS